MGKPLDAFINPNASGNDLRLGEMPKLYDFMSLYGFKEGPKRFDEAMAEWSLRLERALNERLQGKQPVSPGTT